jgi:hypothetical protein
MCLSTPVLAAESGGLPRPLAKHAPGRSRALVYLAGHKRPHENAVFLISLTHRAIPKSQIQLPEMALLLSVSVYGLCWTNGHVS